MADFGENRTIEVPFTSTAVKCPVCEEDLYVQASVRLKSGSVQRAGTAGFRQPILSVHLDTEVVSIKIEHECEVKVDG